MNNYREINSVRGETRSFLKDCLLIVLLNSTFLIVTTSCKQTGEEPIDSFITVSPDSLRFEAKEGMDTLVVKMSGTNWKVSSSQAWCSISKTLSSNKQEQLIITVTPNISRNQRNATLTFILDGTISRVVNVNQLVKTTFLYPDYSQPIAGDSTNMTTNSFALAKNMFVGWNLGNSLEVPTGGETGWGNAKTTQALIDSVKASGINAIRIPCAWDSYIEDATTCKIKDSWLARVKEVVDYCFKNDMYVILNIHWDGGWLEENPTYSMQNAVNAKQQALWEQIAVNFRNYNDHLLFAGTNEVHNSSGDPSAENYAVQQSYLQTFVDAVRNTGGKNSYRTLVVQTFSTNIDKGVQYMKMPKDNSSKRMMVEVHYYDPWDFCGDENSKIYLWGDSFKQYGAVSTWGQDSYAINQMQKVKAAFVDKGYPVILGEYGASRRSQLTGTTLTNHLASRAYYLKFIAQQAKQNGMVPFIWDNGFTGNNGMCIYIRSNGACFDRQTLNAYTEGATAGKYPFK